MKVLYIYRFNMTKHKNDIYKIVVDFIRDIDKQYKEIVADIHFFEFRNQKLRGYKKELLNSEKLREYISISEFNESQMREISFNHILNMNEDEITSILDKAGSDVFYKIVFREIDWFDSLNSDGSQQIFSNITINKSYNGLFIEMWFEVNSLANDYNSYVQKFSDILGIKYCERNTDVYLDEQEKRVYRKADAEITKLFSDIQSELKTQFTVEQKESATKVVFSAILKKMIKGTGHIYNGREGGAYVTFKRDKNNNYLQIIWDYDWNLKQVYAIIRYRIPYSYYGYKLRLPILKKDIDRKNVESYIHYVLKVSDEIIENYSDKIAEKFPKTPEWFVYY